MFKQKLKDELKQAMLTKNALKTSVLRLILSALSYFEIQKGGAGYTASDQDVLSVIEKQIKQRKDSIDQFKKGHREDLAEKETLELEILQTYLPEQMSEEQILEKVKQAIAKTNASSLKDMGKVMQQIVPELKGKADATIISNLVKKQLS